MRIKLSIIIISLLNFISCTKDCNNNPTTTTKTPEELLTSKTWKADEIRVQQSNGTSQYYKRGGTSNTTNYDSDSLKFSLNNTGVYYYLGTQYSTVWNFTNTDKSKMTLVINYSTPLNIYLENINLSDNYFTYSQYVITGGSYLASGRRTPN